MRSSIITQYTIDIYQEVTISKFKRGNTKASIRLIQPYAPLVTMSGQCLMSCIQLLRGIPGEAELPILGKDNAIQIQTLRVLR